MPFDRILPVLFVLTMQSSCAGEKENNRTESGFDEAGEFVTCDALPSDHRCPSIGTRFSDACLDAGFEIRHCKHCELLCTGRVDVDYSKPWPDD